MGGSQESALLTSSLVNLRQVVPVHTSRNSSAGGAGEESELIPEHIGSNHLGGSFSVLIWSPKSLASGQGARLRGAGWGGQQGEERSEAIATTSREVIISL